MPTEIRHRRLLPLLVAGLATIGPFTIDTYLPSFPAIAAEMQTTEVLVQQTLTAYLIPFAFMMLFHGAISDAVGRRPVILLGLGGYVIASIGCALAPNMHVLLICRAMQGLVAGASTSLSRAVVRDAYQGVEAQRLMARVMLIFSIAPAIAPVIGGGLQAWFGWRANFWFLALFGAVLVVSCCVFSPQLPWSVVHQVIYGMGMAMAMPSLTLMLLDLFPHNRGMAASLHACVQSMAAGFVAAIASPLFSASAAMLAFGAILFALAALVLWLAYLMLPQTEVPS